ncbi:unnamed protein product [Blepharisma stoltei]|uniref:Uncharacterized protein n=1 Tax=Blepharisma stoltei TaxID=1481888 RepID=A0AAU9IJ80_9CILI|nr:unnamed protein product [Blepharisma stoltei]
MEDFKSSDSTNCSQKIGHDWEWISSDSLKLENLAYCSLGTSEPSIDSEIIFAKSNEITRREMILWLIKEKEGELTNSQKISECENNMGLESLFHDPQNALENLKNLFPKIDCNKTTSSSTEINKDMERLIESVAERKIENLIKKLKIQMKDQLSKLNSKEMLMSEKLDKLEEKFELVINENKKLHKLILNNKNETILAQPKENKFDIYMAEKLAKKAAQISELKIKLENYSSEYYSSLENLPKFKKMKTKLLKQFNIEKILMAKFHASHYIEFENYITIYNEISDKLNKLTEELSVENKCIYGVNRDQNQTILWTYDAKTHNKYSTRIVTPIPLSIYTCITKLPNNELFCYGSWTPLSGVTCIIDLKSKTLKRSLPDGLPSIASGAVYHNNCVYVFGRCTTGSDTLNSARKFDLEENSWKDLTNLPAAAYYCSCIVFKGSILLSGHQHYHLYKYSIQTNNYEVLLSNLDNAYKIQFKLKQRIYILQSNGTSYESVKGNEYIWNKISTGSYSAHRNSLITYNRGSALISLQEHNGMHCYKFSLKKKKIKELL